MVYLGHRSFLQADDPLHEDKKNFPHKQDTRQPPKNKTMNFLHQAVIKYANAPTKKNMLKCLQSDGCKGFSILRTLPFHDQHLFTPVEPMHLIKNIAEHIVRLLSGAEDSRKVRKEEQKRKRFKDSWVTDSNSKILPPAPFILSKTELELANDRAKKIRVPISFDWRPRDIFGSKGMKSHEWKEVACSGILKYCLVNLLGSRQRSTLFKLFDLLSKLYSSEISDESSLLLEQETHKTLAMMERDFPVSLHVIVFHLLHHLPSFLARLGPVNGYWMYPFERFNSWISRRVTNRRFPESTVVETYRYYDLAGFLEMSGMIPNMSVAMISSSSSHDMNDPPNLNNEATLTRKDHLLLREIYRQENSEYKALYDRYEKEKQSARKYHKLKTFPEFEAWSPLTGPLLTETEQAFCNGPQVTISIFNSYSYRDHFNRESRITSQNSSASQKLSTSVAVCQASGVSFGSVRYFFSNKFVDTTTVFAYIDWYSDPQPEYELMMLSASLKSSDKNPIVPVYKIFKGLVTATDPADENRLWILNYSIC